MEYYLINIICNFFLLLVIRQFLGDFLQFETGNRIKRAVFSVCWLVGTFAVNELFHVPVVNLFTNVLLMLLISSVYEGKLIKKLAVCMIIAVLGAACDMLAYALTIPFLGESDYFYSMALTVVFLLVIERVLRITIRRGKSWDVVGKEMLVLSGFPILAAVLLYCVTAMEAGIYRLIACISVLGISTLSVILYNRLAINLGDRMRKIYLEREVEAYKHEMELMRISDRKEQNLRHDLRHHLFEIEGLAKQGEDEKICTYIDELRRTFVDSKQMVHTGEYETDSLINYLLDNAKNHQIDVTCDIKIPEDIDVSRCKLNVIVGNLLENAIEAAAQADEKRIVLTMQFSAGILFLQIKNTYNGPVRVEGGHVLGKKSQNNHGIGLRSVQDLVREQNGSLDISVTDQFFVAEGMIPVG
ncbi:sensor histidine kinase [Butyrivibrio sp. YAB3001]|uniref:sensor histidine kinase n=1 Tax=Butyrivibrio sp. YAB3001 TaxID=1520812 RepID=UPI0008F64B09|nr:sensor histidine kinase [Butyrivibrio sp. YAB3001]SFC30385.1 GHKL domain-containing protein [Butyrivibrio sp. YAB3001]